LSYAPGSHYTLYPQPLYTASQVRMTSRSWDKGVLTDLCLTRVLTDLCLTWVLTDLCLTLYRGITNSFAIFAVRMLQKLLCVIFQCSIIYGTVY